MSDRSGLWVTADLGNSRLKLRAWSVATGCAPERRAGADIAGDGETLVERLASWMAGLTERPAAVLSSVAADGTTAKVRGALAQASSRLLVDPEPGLENRTLAPEGVGLDRLWAAAGALGVLDASCLVVDVGTALTVDAVLREPDGRGAFLGGTIAPGPALLARSLSQWAARLPEVEPVVGAPALGRDTEEAIRSGVGVGLRGSARELVGRIAREAGLEHAPVVLTGGASSHLMLPEPVFEGTVHLVEDLVHLGLLRAARTDEPADG